MMEYHFSVSNRPKNLALKCLGTVHCETVNCSLASGVHQSTHILTNFKVFGALAMAPQKLTCNHVETIFDSRHRKIKVIVCSMQELSISVRDFQKQESKHRPILFSFNFSKIGGCSCDPPPFAIKTKLRILPLFCSLCYELIRAPKK